MIIVLKPRLSKRQESTVLKEIRSMGYRPHVMRGVARTVIGAIGDELTHQSLETLATLFPDLVESVMPVQKRYKLVSREGHPEDSSIPVRNLAIGGRKFHVMAGPCSVESESQLLETARAVKAAGATILRGGAFKPRTSPYEFQGLGEKGLKLLAKARKETGLAVITELLSEAHAGHGRGVCRHSPDRSPQFTELSTPDRRGQDGQAHPVETRAFNAHRGMAPRRRIHPRP